MVSIDRASTKHDLLPRMCVYNRKLGWCRSMNGKTRPYLDNCIAFLGIMNILLVVGGLLLYW